MISIIDHGYCNLHSINFALRKLGYDPKITNKKIEILKSSHLIVPGVGAFGAAMNELKTSGLDETITEFANTGKKIICICLGMHLLATKSFEYGAFDGLNLIPGEVKKLNPKEMKIPNVGWRKTSFFEPLSSDFQFNEAYFYFTHSYEFIPQNKEHSFCEITYGTKKITAGLKHQNIFATQFHPEKSGELGLALLGALLNGS